MRNSRLTLTVVLIACLSCALFAIVSKGAPDLRSVATDLTVPRLEDGPAAPGRRVKEILKEYADTNVYHVIYLPTDWQSGRSYPVICEYAGNGGYENEFGDVSTGRVEGSKLGYGLTAGRGFIWICLPYLNDASTENVTIWWGDPPNHDPESTVRYCKEAVSWVCANYGGDSTRVVLMGFSRGAIACNFIGLHDHEISRLWRAFVPFSHYDGVVNWGFQASDRAAAAERLSRLGDRPQFICAEEGRGKHSTATTEAYLDETGVTGKFTFRGTGFRNHSDEWILRPSTARDELRRWLAKVLE